MWLLFLSKLVGSFDFLELSADFVGPILIKKAFILGLNFFLIKINFRKINFQLNKFKYKL
jgi:hypothetical protein